MSQLQRYHLSQLNKHLWDFTNACQKEMAEAVELKSRGESMEVIEGLAGRNTRKAQAAWAKAKEHADILWAEIKS